MPYPKNFHGKNRIKRALDLLRPEMTQVEFAQSQGVSLSTAKRWLSNRRQPNEKQRAILVEFFKIPEHQIFTS